MWKITGRERLFKQSILPMLAYMIVIPVFSVFSNGKKSLDNVEQMYSIFLYFSIMTSSMIPSVITIGSNAQSGWIYRTFPNMKPSTLFANTVKAAMGRYFLPVFVVLSLPLFYFKGIFALNDIATIYLFNYLVAMLILYNQKPYLPFSQDKMVAQGGKTALRMILIILVALPVGFLHFYLAKQSNWLVLSLAALFAIVIALTELHWYPRKMTWKSVEITNR